MVDSKPPYVCPPGKDWGLGLSVPVRGIMAEGRAFQALRFFFFLSLSPRQSLRLSSFSALSGGMEKGKLAVVTHERPGVCQQMEGLPPRAK